jgi:hypothetical protein
VRVEENQFRGEREEEKGKRTNVDALNGDLRTSSHLGDVLLEAGDALTVDLLNDDVTLGGNGGLGGGREGNVLVERGLTDHLLAVVEEGLTELLGEDVLLTLVSRGVVDGVLHVVELLSRWRNQ